MKEIILELIDININLLNVEDTTDHIYWNKFKNFIKDIPTEEELAQCNGYNESDCCGANIVNGICTECREYCENRCSECDYENICNKM